MNPNFPNYPPYPNYEPSLPPNFYVQPGESTPLVSPIGKEPVKPIFKNRLKKRSFLFSVLFIVCISMFLLAVLLSLLMIVYVIKCEKGNNESTLIFTANAKNANNFDIINHNGFIVVYSSQEESPNITIRVVRKAGYQSYLNDYDTIFTANEGNIHFEERVTEENMWSWLGTCRKSEIWVQLPSFDSQEPNFRAEQESGEIQFQDIEDYPMKSLSAQTQYGEISAVGVNASLIQIQNFFGSVKVANLTASKISISSNRGNIGTLEGKITLTKKTEERPLLDISTIIGNIDFGCGIDLESPTDIFLKVRKGSISAKTLEFAGKFELRANSGNVEAEGDVNFDEDRKNFKNGTVGEGSSLLMARISRGNIVVDFS